MIILKRKWPIRLTGLLIVSMVLAGVLLASFTNSRAADLRNFDPGNIMSDAAMSNTSTMSVGQIQTFLDSKNPCNNRSLHLAGRHPNLKFHIKDGVFVCMAKESFNGESAAQIIWQAAKDYKINPQVLLVLLEKEQSLVTDTWPSHIQYRSATGYGCPDTAPCDTQFYGLKNQVRKAASLFREVLDGGWTNYPVGDNRVYYHPNSQCGYSTVAIKNRATSALYRYTPYQPNQAALSAGYGTGDGCSAYGNRNFWLLFSDWFGSPTSGTYLDLERATAEITKLNANNTLGRQLSRPYPEYDNKPRIWASFEKATVIWSEAHGAQAIPYETTHTRWRELGGSLGSLGLPAGPATQEASDGRTWQDFEFGTIIFSPSTGGWELYVGPIGDTWRAAGGSAGALGKPISSVSYKQGFREQRFEKGTIVRSESQTKAFFLLAAAYTGWEEGALLGMPRDNTVLEQTGHAWQLFEKGLLVKSAAGHFTPVAYGKIHETWQRLGGSSGSAGKPVAKAYLQHGGLFSTQRFDTGVIILNNETGDAGLVINEPIYSRWQQSHGKIGTPTSSRGTESDGRSWQYFTKGVFIHSKKTGAWEIEGNFMHYWHEHGGSRGRLGMPLEAKIIDDAGVRRQRFERGSIVWSPSAGWSIQ